MKGKRIERRKEKEGRAMEDKEKRQTRKRRESGK